MRVPTNNEINDLWRVVDPSKIFEPLTYMDLFDSVIPYFQDKGYFIKIECHEENGYSVRATNVITDKSGITYGGKELKQCLFWSLYDEIKNVEGK
jgi:hypothetical protein